MNAPERTAAATRPGEDAAMPSRRQTLCRLAAGLAVGGLTTTGGLLAGCQTAEPVPSPTLPPGRVLLPLTNAGFTPDDAGRFPGWVAVEHNVGNSYRFEPDREVYAMSAPASARISRYGPEIYGLLEQRVRAQPDWIGRTARLSGFLRTRGVNGAGASLVLQARDGSDQILASEQMDGRKLVGDLDWQQHAIQLRLPPATWWVRVGVMLEDGGTIWADDLALELMD